MTARWPVRRPTEAAAIRAAARSARPLPHVPALAAHRVVRAAAPEVGTP